MKGTFDSIEGRMLNIHLRKCIGKDNCKSDQEISEYFKGTYILVLKNNVRFQPRFYGNEAVLEESSIDWIPIRTQSQVSVPFKVQSSRINLQDYFVNFDSLTELENDRVFGLQELPLRPAEWDENVIINIQFEVSLDLMIVIRDGYTVIDILSDLGGINAVFMVVFPMIIQVIQSHRLD